MRYSPNSRPAPQSEDDEQVVRLVQALNAPRVRTSGAASVFDMARGRRVPTPDPRSLQVIDIPPLKSRVPPSPWHAVYEALPTDGKAVVLTREQAVSLFNWAREKGFKVRRRAIDGDTSAVWRA